MCYQVHRNAAVMERTSNIRVKRGYTLNIQFKIHVEERQYCVNILWIFYFGRDCEYSEVSELT